ncbi:MAG: CCA tRNA nucleotidyltransferase [Actinomycetes bacterium]
MPAESPQSSSHAAAPAPTARTRSPTAGSVARPSPVLDAVRSRVVAELAEFAPAALDLGARFCAAGHELALVGGPVRDAFLNRLAPGGAVDLDLTTDAAPDETLALLEGWADATWEIGREYGTIGCRKGRSVLEVTTYRSDSYDPASRKPSVRFGTSLEGDLSRRDFTVNAMAVALPGLEFVDPYGGLTDLVGRMLRTPGTPEQSFGDDPLRMMRAARFVAQLGFSVAPEVEEAMRAMAERLGIVSAERVRTELEKLVLGRTPRAGLELMVDTGLADQVLPELPALKLEIDEHHRHKDVYEHTLTVLEQAIALEDPPGDTSDGAVPAPDFVLRFAALMHDVGKPATRRFEPGGGVSFHHHEVVGAKMTARRMKALRFDSATTKSVARLVELHLRFHGYGGGQWTDSAVRRYVTDAGPLLPRLHRLTRADCTTRNRRKAAALAASYDDLEQRVERLLEAEELASVRPDLDGTQIMALLGVRPGPLVGRAYKHLLALRMEHGPLPEEQARQALLDWWEQQPESAPPGT